MKTVLNIAGRDFKALLKNPIALLVVGALLVLPGLYAWYCIVANWDPYANTGNVPIAVVNYDEGASSDLTGEVNIGRQVIDKLSENDSIDWKFYDDKDAALEDTALSLCYATIVFPEDLSKNVIGIFEGSGNKPTVYYYPNEKYNAVATKVADSAAQTLIRQVNQQFSSTVNETLLTKVQDVADKVEGKASESHVSAMAEIKRAEGDIDKVIESLDDALSSIDGWKNASNGARGALAGTEQQLPAIGQALKDGSDDLQDLRTATAGFEGSFSSTLLRSSSLMSGLSMSVSSRMNTAAADLNAIGTSIDSAIATLETAARDLGIDEIDSEIAVKLRNLLSTLKSKRSSLNDAIQRANASVSSMNERVQDAAENIVLASGTFSDEIMPELNDGTYDLATSLTGLSTAIAQFEPQVRELQSVLGQAETALDRANEAIGDAKTLLVGVSANLKSTVEDFGLIGNALQIDEVSDLLHIDPDNLGTFVSSPVQMVTEKVFPVSNYGTAVAPFYTNLALWIGCFILISIIKLEVNPKGFESATTTQRYFARWLMLVILSLIQSQVICGVDILLGIDCANPGLFMLAGAVCSFVYMNLLYALVIAFRNIGRTLCILLLIMQVPGSSGMYPIEMMPKFFRVINPALPFTYGIDAMREALCGMYDTTYFGDLAIILAIVPISLLLGLMFRPYLMNLTNLFDTELQATGFIASEEHGQARDVDTLRRMMRALSSHDAYRDDAEARAWAFNKRYPRLRRMGTVAICAIPFLFVVLFSPWSVTINTKLTWLMIMIAVMLVILFGLVVLEYVHRAISEETEMLGSAILQDEFPEYLTLADQVDDARQDVEERVDQARDEVLDTVQEAVGIKPVSTGSRKRRGGVARAIFFTDMRLGFKSVIGVTVIMLLVITPSLYAWINIAGSWSPYDSTDQLKVAVANEDEGYKGNLVPVTLSVGDTVVSQLRSNNSFDWQFVGKDDAIAGVESGEYYAGIVIPEDFSLNMMTYLTDDADYPDVVYYTNEKENPIAPIITQKGADSIQENIRTSFTQRIDEVGLTIAYDLLNYVTNPRVSDYAKTMGEHLDDATHDMKLGASELKTLSSVSSAVASVVDSAGTALDGVMAASDSAKDALGTAKSGIGSASSAFERISSLVREMTAGSEGFDDIEDTLDAALSSLENGARDLPTVLSGASNSTGEWASMLSALAADLKEGILVDDQLASTVDSLASSLGKLSSSLKTAADDSATASGSIASTRDELSELIGETRTALGEMRSFYDDDVQTSIGDLKSTMTSVSESTQSIVTGLEGAVGGLADSTSGLSNQLNSLSGGLENTGGKLEMAANSLESVKRQVSEALSSGDVKQIEMVLLGSDTETMAKSLAAPIQEEREAMYPIANYGSSMAPFYTVLSLWVGALVMISTMRVHVAEERIEELRQRYRRVKPRHEFFGRYGIFGFISLMQSALVLLGDLLFLHIQCVNPVLFFLGGLFIGQVFCLIVFTLTELFGDVGKALCIILLIMQVAASGGTFPIEMLAPLLEGIVPFLPFYHAMSLLQECVAGIYWPAAILNASALLVIIGSMLLIGVVVRKPFRKLNDVFEAQLEKTGYM